MDRSREPINYCWRKTRFARHTVRILALVYFQHCLSTWHHRELIGLIWMDYWPTDDAWQMMDCLPPTVWTELGQRTSTVYLFRKMLSMHEQNENWFKRSYITTLYSLYSDTMKPRLRLRQFLFVSDHSLSVCLFGSWCSLFLSRMA